MLHSLLQMKARRYSLMPNGRRVLVSERQVVNNSGVPKILSQDTLSLCPYRRHHDPIRTIIAEAQAVGPAARPAFSEASERTTGSDRFVAADESRRSPGSFNTVNVAMIESE